MHYASTCIRAILTVTLTNLAQSTVYHGILINGQRGGTQMYDPFNAPHARGNLQLGLPEGEGAHGGGAVINGQLAYFVGASGGVSIIAGYILAYCSS